jgi:hypothetical protein
MIERWLPISGYEHWYEVSNLGRVRSFARGPVRILARHSNKDGYPLVSLNRDGRRHGFAVHRLVAETHVPGRNVLHKEVAHLDGDRANARADNLKWVSKVENHSHKRLHGTHQGGEMHPRAKLTEAEAREIGARARRGESAARIGREFGVAGSTVRDIRDYRRWRAAQATSLRSLARGR